jgi:hypothetical protein
MEINFKPDQTLWPFWKSTDFYQFTIGPLGSTKTTNYVMKLLTIAANQAKGHDGLRRTRFAISRQTLQQIKTTVLKDIEYWLSPIINYKVSDSVIQIRQGDIHSDWHLIPLEDPQDQRRLLSMQLTVVYFNEFRELPMALVAAAAGRVGRYPSKGMGGCSYYGVWGDSNPPSVDSQWYNFLVQEPPDNLTYVHQPGGLDPAATWRHHLPDNYYENLMQGHDEQWVDIHIHSKWGESVKGQAVYKRSFSEDFHVAKNTLTPIPGYPLIVGCDFARWPAAVICQIDNRGRLLVFKELEMENTGVEKFCNEALIPELYSDRFRRNTSFMVGDPSGVSRSQIGEESVFDMLKRLGFVALPATTNNIAPRLRAVEKWLIQQRDGGPGLLIDPEGCPKLIRGFRSDYRFKMRRSGIIEDVPDKSRRPYADLHDALQYACLGTADNIRGRYMRRNMSRSAQPPFSAAAWT